MEDPYHSWKPITNLVVGTTLSLLTISVPFIILVEPTHQDNDQGHHRQVRRVQS